MTSYQQTRMERAQAQEDRRQLVQSMPKNLVALEKYSSTRGPRENRTDLKTGVKAMGLASIRRSTLSSLRLGRDQEADRDVD
jgi:hypothetical protein